MYFNDFTKKYVEIDYKEKKSWNWLHAPKNWFHEKIREIGCSKTDEICSINSRKNREIDFAKKSKEVSLMISHKNFEISMVVQKR